MSTFVAKPKVFKGPKAIPAAPRKRSWSVLAPFFEYRQYAYLVAGIGGLMVLVLGQSFVVSGAPVQNPDVARHDFTFFAPSDSNAATPNQPFVINGKNQMIVGQIADMPADSQELGNIKATTEVDIKANKDLLSVVNKY